MASWHPHTMDCVHMCTAPYKHTILHAVFHAVFHLLSYHCRHSSSHQVSSMSSSPSPSLLSHFYSTSTRPPLLPLLSYHSSHSTLLSFNSPNPTTPPSYTPLPPTHILSLLPPLSHIYNYSFNDLHIHIQHS